MIKRTNRALGWLAIALLALAAPALAGHHEGGAKGPGKGDRKPPTAEQRVKMAEHHERMAACLRSDRPIGECRAEMRAMHETMRKQCQENGGGDCPMGHGYHRGHHDGKYDGKGKGGGMKKGGEDAATDETAPTS
ncbi:MAG: hypothetical protein R3F35_12030 [Myxococcota bacterium]